MVLKVIISVFVFALGACISSFAYVVAVRVPMGISVVKPASHCFNCGAKIKPYDNIPIISYIILRGRCRSCGGKIGAQSFMVELFGGAAFLFAYFVFFTEPYIIPFAFFLTALFLVMACVDMQTKTIYNATLWIYFAVSVAFVLVDCAVNLRAPVTNVIGAAVGFSFFALVYVVGFIFCKEEALGDGDVFIVAISGLLLGVEKLLIALLIGSVSGCIAEISTLAKTDKWQKERVAFAPYLLFGTYSALLAGDFLIYSVVDAVAYGII